MNNHLFSKKLKKNLSLFRVTNSVNYSFWIFTLIGLFVFVGCNTNKIAKTNDTAKQLVIYPAPPEPARIQFLTKITSSADLGKKQSFLSKLILGQEKSKAMVKPYGISIHKGKLYVCDQYGGGMEIIDLETRDFHFFRPGGKGMLRAPINCSVDEKGYLYVADVGRQEIVVFDDKGKYVRCFGEKEKFKPTDVVVYQDKIFVANTASSKINVYSADSTNKLLYSFPEVDPTNQASLGIPANIAVEGDRVYAADFGYSMIKRYTIDGKFIDTIGSRGDRPGQFSKLKGIAVDRESNIYAVDAGFDHVQIFNKDGKLLLVIGGHYQGPGGLIIPAKVMIDYDNLKYFEKYVDPSYDLKYLIFVTSQYGPDLINVYGRVDPKGASPSK